jgi:2-polyprenyl-6-methoxyphenol hydroxylase-like FAD-dependent oxidoreductase
VRAVRAIVIGAGIGGLAAGIALGRAGIDVEVYEQADELREVGAGLSLWANAVQALDRLGLGDTVRSFSTTYGVAGLRTWRGDIITAPSPDLERELGVLCIVMHRAELLEALVGALGRERIRTGARCQRFVEEPDGVTAEFADGRRARGDVLVGADGLHSVVRAQIHGAAPPAYAGYTAWRAVVTFDRDAVSASESWGDGARFGMVPMSGGRVYWFATETAPEGGRHADEQAHLSRLFRGWHHPIEALIRSTEPGAILRNDIYDRPVLRTWGRGRVTLLGDAAHPMTPNLGQGACQALEDAIVLARSLAAGSPLRALRSYEAQRIRRANLMVTRSRHVGAIGQWANPLAVRARNALLRSISPRAQARQLLRMLKWKADS